MSRATRIQTEIETRLTPAYFDIQNESHQHAGNQPDSHFRLVVVSEQFSDKSLLARHRLIQNLLQQERDNGLHALALHTYTPDEWLAKGEAPESPACAGQNA
jgi:BolA protein